MQNELGLEEDFLPLQRSLAWKYPKMTGVSCLHEERRGSSPRGTWYCHGERCIGEQLARSRLLATEPRQWRSGRSFLAERDARSLCRLWLVKESCFPSQIVEPCWDDDNEVHAEP